MFSDPRLARLFELLTKGETPEVTPVFSLRSPAFCRYPWAETLLELPTAQVNQMLEDLARSGYLKRQFHDKVIFCPVCNSLSLRYVALCPKCGSRQILQTQVLEHIACGTIAPEADFRHEQTFTCPKCQRELELLGSDYRMPGIHFRCYTCGTLSPRPAEKWHCDQCREQLDYSEIRELCLYSYVLGQVPSEPSRAAEAPLGRIEEFLVREGYRTQKEVKVTGRSGAVHEIDLLATKNSSTFEHRIVVGFAANDAEVDSEEVIKLYAKAYDVNAQDIVLVAIPHLSEDAVQFASHYRIKVLEASDLEHIGDKLLVPTPPSEV